MPETSPSARGDRSPLHWLMSSGGGALLIVFGVIGAALIVVPIIVISLGRGAHESLDELAGEVDPIAIRLARVHVDVVRLVNEATRVSLSRDPDPERYEETSRRYATSRALLASAARGTQWEDDVFVLLTRADRAAEAAADGIEATLRGDNLAAEALLIGQSPSLLDEVGSEVAVLQDRLDEVILDRRERSRRLSNLELLIGAGGSMLGAVTVLSLLGIEFARRRLLLASDRDRARFAGMVDATGFGVLELDARGVIVYANPAAAELLGRRAEDLLGERDREVLASPTDEEPPAVGGTEGPLLQAIAVGEPYFGEETVVRSDGEPLTLEVSSAPIGGAVEGGPRGIRRSAVLVFQDLSERIARERQQAEFLAMASHELRTPLTSVVGFSRRLLKGVESGRITVDEGTQEELETLHREAERMREMVTVFLDLARLDANALELETLPVELTELVDEEVDRLRQRWPQARVRIELPEHEALVETDEQRVRQVVANLLDNGAKYGGSPPELTVRVEEDGGGFTIAVRDNGAGIPLEEQARIFERFFRSRATASRRQGLGLGLHISKQLADHLGAELTVASEPGEGTEFRFWLPSAQRSGARRRQGPAARLTWSTRS